MISPLLFQRTAIDAGAPVRGSTRPFCDTPTVCPPLLIHSAKLLLPPGSVPRSLKTPFCHLNACWTKQLGAIQFGAKGSGLAVSAPPTTAPWLFMILASWGNELEGPPKVPKSTSLYRGCCPACAINGSASEPTISASFKGLT